MKLLNDMKVASTKATLDVLDHIPPSKLKKLLCDIIIESGLTFSESDFIAKITDKYWQSLINKEK